MERQLGKLGQPQNLPPTFFPVLAVRMTIVAPHLGQAGAVGVEAEPGADTGSTGAGVGDGLEGTAFTCSLGCK
jgi:hypothetical protein